MKGRCGLTVVLCIGWAGFIFATSSTVILPRQFFAWFRANVFDDPEAFRKFEVFWGMSWLFIVKGWHVTEFAILTLLTTFMIKSLTKQQSESNVWIAALICVVYAASDEWHQTFVPKRGGVVDDVLIDCLGIGVTALLLSRRFRNKVELGQGNSD